MKKKKIEFYNITRLSKADILSEFENDEDFNKVKKRVAKMTDSEMQYLASKLADDYCEQLFWGSLRTIFEDEFMNETKHDGG